MKQCIVLSLMLAFMAQSALGQLFQWKTLCSLDSRLEGISGITSLNGGYSFWVMADNNSPSELYEIDSSCNILRILVVRGVNKRDWEDLASDPKGNLYIGDFGNNNNNRKDQKILILQNVEQLTVDSITPEVINIVYANQTDFPPAAPFRNFDMEAMVWAHDSLHLFSKNRTDPFSGYTYQYSFPAKAGSFSLHPIDSFKTGAGPMLFYWVTGAAYLENPASLALTAHDRFWLFDQFEGTRFFKGRSREIVLPNYTQKEGICIANSRNIYFTDEYNSTLRLGRQLYRLEWEPSYVGSLDSMDMIQVWPNPSKNLMTLLLPMFKEGKPQEFQILDISGKILMQFTMDHARKNIPLESLGRGLYIIKEMRGRIVQFFSKMD